jgi:isoleucyl-tRNA synthetase
MRRVPEVIDCWFDSGAMPVSQRHYPFENQELFEQTYPADYVCEAVDQTRGWFYSLHALSTLIFDRPCFKNVICLGHILDAKGEKMSKAKGNVVDPQVLLGNQGADALRWYLLTSSPAGNVKRFSAEQVTEAMRKFLLTLWNTYSFFVSYANIDRFDPTSAQVPQYESSLDRWITSELNQLIVEVTEALDGYDPTEAGRRIENFVEELSNWYVRRSRRRFWKSENDADKLSAYNTLYQCLLTTAKLLAPLTPFVAEEIYQNLVRSVDSPAVESVHLTDFPKADLSKIDEQDAANVRAVMKVSSLGRAARSKANIKVRQPLAKVLVKAKSGREREGLKQLATQVLDELNVKEMEFIKDEAQVLEFEVKPNLPLLGPKYGKEIGKIVDALRNADAAAVARDIQAGRDLIVLNHRLSPNEILLATHDKSGYATATGGGYTVAISTHIPPKLVDEGIAREIVHRLQTMRRNAGFDIPDYIVSYYSGDEAIEQVIAEFTDYIKQETLSRQLIKGLPERDSYSEEHRIDGFEVMLGVRKEQNSR